MFDMVVAGLLSGHGHGSGGSEGYRDPRASSASPTSLNRPVRRAADRSALGPCPGDASTRDNSRWPDATLMMSSSIFSTFSGIRNMRRCDIVHVWGEQSTDAASITKLDASLNGIFYAPNLEEIIGTEWYLTTPLFRYARKVEIYPHQGCGLTTVRICSLHYPTD